MESRGRIIAVLPRTGGVSARTGKEWATQAFVIETHDQYPKKQCYEVFGDDRIKEFANLMVLGCEVVVSFDLESREWTYPDGTTTWFTSARSWKVQGAGATPAQPVQAQPAPPPVQNPFPPMAAPVAPAQNAEDGDDLPF